MLLKIAQWRGYGNDSDLMFAKETTEGYRFHHWVNDNDWRRDKLKLNTDKYHFWLELIYTE